MITPDIAWFHKYAPKTLDELILNKNERILTERWIQEESIDGNLLLASPPGLGKTSLAKILINNIVKISSDLYKMKSRSVNEIDDEIKSFLLKRPQKSKKKIIYIEEFDRLGSSKVALDELKDGLMENYIETCIFICTTNKIKKIPGPIISRFTHRFLFNDFSEEEINKRLSYILEQESAVFDKNELIEFIKKYKKIGIRELVNYLQTSFASNNGNIIFNQFQESSKLEESVVLLTTSIIKKLFSITDPSAKKSCLITPLTSDIGQDYQTLVNILHNNIDIDYDTVYTELYEKTSFIPIQYIINQYLDNYELKKYPNLHYISMLYETLKCILELTA